ncbi:hypothetical protein GXW82_41385 [Streptacidiphilus sp. 4-A2]|nr:hypothetical protein [Streptacidiphilus sp. 4-A2]
MRTNLRASVVAVMATVCVAMGTGTALADCGPWDQGQGYMDTDHGAAHGALAANSDVVAYDGPSGHVLLGHHNVAGAAGAHW